MTNPQKVVLPASDLVKTLREQLTIFGVPPASFAEVVTQCLDVYMDWNGDEDQIALLPYFNRIVIPAMTGEQYQDVYDSTQYLVQTFAKQIFARLMHFGFFPKTHTQPNMDYGFERFAGQDIVLFHFNP
jgi:hypothetical protein